MPNTSDTDILQTLLSGASALAALPPEARNAIGRHLYHRHFEAGEVLIGQGNTDKDLYLLGVGEARVTFRDHSGKVVEIGRLHPGDIFGEWSLLTNRPRAATVTALSNGSVYLLHKEDYEIVLDSYLSLVQYLLRALSIRQREYAGLLAAELNLWASSFGGMNKNHILTVSFLSVAAAPSASITTLTSTGRFRLWAVSLEALAERHSVGAVVLQEEVRACLAGVNGRQFAGDHGLGAGLASIVSDLSRYPTFPEWRSTWMTYVEQALQCLEGPTASGGTDQSPRLLLLTAYLATLHIVFDPVSHPELANRLHTLDQQAAQVIGQAHDLQVSVGRIRAAQRRPGYPVPDAGARGGRRAIERQLRELDRMAKGLPGTVHGSTSAVITLTRLLIEYFLGILDLRPRSTALPYNV